MQTKEPYLNLFKQNNKLALRLISPTFGHFSPELIADYGLKQRKTHYFFLFMIEGKSKHSVDLQEFEIKNDELLFILPHQMHQLPANKKGTDYFKLGFDDDCLSLLPKQYPFLLNPYNNQKMVFAPLAAARLKSIFEIMRQLLGTPETDPELILAHLNSLLTEMNAVYFATSKNPADERLSKYIRFKVFVESNLTELPSITDIAKKLALNTNSLYNIVKHYSGLSPKEFIMSRLMLEAKRRLCYAESSSIKELAFQLGFNDPDYFSRLFKRSTGKTIASFVQDLSAN